jgi:hypothetical protein
MESSRVHRARRSHSGDARE